MLKFVSKLINNTTPIKKNDTSFQLFVKFVLFTIEIFYFKYNGSTHENF